MNRHCVRGINSSKQTIRVKTSFHIAGERFAPRCRTRGLCRSRASTSSNGVVAVEQQLRDWHDVDQPLLWQGNEDDALTPGSPASYLPAPWKMLLLSDGSVTRHLQLLTGQPVAVECLSMDLLPGSQLHKPPAKALEIPGPLVQRQVLLWSNTSPRVPLVYAASWWASATVDRYLADKDLPIWVSLAKGHLELYREIQQVTFGHNPVLKECFGCEGPFWGRQYYFWHAGAPLTLIHEVFSNKLQNYLGPPAFSVTDTSGSRTSTDSGKQQQQQQ